VLELPKGLFGVQRQAPDGSQRIFFIANLTGAAISLSLARVDRRWKQRAWRELLGGWQAEGETMSDKLELAPYQVFWLTPLAVV
jgi:hypothetical protein